MYDDEKLNLRFSNDPEVIVVGCCCTCSRRDGNFPCGLFVLSWIIESVESVR